MSAHRPLLLFLDDALDEQRALLAQVRESHGATLDGRDLGPALRLWTRPRAFAELRNRLRDEPLHVGDIIFAGSGDFHHVTLLLLSRALEAAGDPPTTLLHFDNHPDWVKFDNGVHCGSWAARAAQLPSVERVITIGLCSTDIDKPQDKGADLSVVAQGRVELYPFNTSDRRPMFALCGHSWPTISSLGESTFAEFLANRVETASVYVTIDKDVLRADDAVTNWDQGVTRLDFLLDLIEQACARARLIGADVVGDWSRPRYAGFISSALKRGEAALDQPWRTPDHGRAAAINERTNLALLHTLMSVGV